ncbi:NAD(P)-dependent oxidoreductase [Microbacterium sp. SORGH_AS_0862]|uniref:NAD-dependent epimerase/dehydratase family protein n=1 Tax=Microbacterium sp. SORGH_AS_0862 TaxID=3041789 RepID=UPI00278D4BF5|nr:NAD-dependent epimerase/dehydratase family protein [Microbacterium sp. SORGH_AS_0862]MDQ1204242.1 dTDP-L-rhamnose 4-epimerase [Microbacterium sp. SORGH_AS_0862]
MPSRRTGGVLVTGGAGFIGSALSRLAAPSAARWVALDSLNRRIHETPGRPPALDPAAELVVGDIVDERAWDEVLDDWHPDTVVHLAAETDTGLSLTSPTRFTRTNVDGTAQLLEALDRHDARPRRIVVASSRAVYGEGTWTDRRTGAAGPRPQRSRQQLQQGQWDFPDASPVVTRAGVTREHPTNVYGVTKLAQEGLLSSWCGAYDVALTILRLQNVYGPGQSLINPYTGILALFVRQSAAGIPIGVYEDGQMLRDFVHIDDVARAFATVVGDGYTEPGVRTLDIGTGRPATVLEMASALAASFGAPSPVITGEFREGDIRHAWCTVDEASEHLGWRARVDWEDGLRDYADWYRKRQEQAS